MCPRPQGSERLDASSGAQSALISLGERSVGGQEEREDLSAARVARVKTMAFAAEQVRWRCACESAAACWRFSGGGAAVVVGGGGGGEQCLGRVHVYTVGPGRL